jgi:WD40 repeat protein/uncharacterized caspase-like protein
MKRWFLVYGGLGALIVAGLSPGFAQERAAALPRPQVWTIVIGVGNYRDNSFLDSKTAAQNASEVLQWFRRAGWESDHQLLLSDFGRVDPGRPNAPAPKIEPLKQNLDWAIRDWLLPRAKSGDLVVFYFAGQAVATVKTQGPKVEPRVDYYLLPTDAGPDTLEQKGFSLDKAVQECVGKRLQVVCWLATSLRDQAGKVLPPPAPGDLGTSRPSAKNWLARLTRWRGVTVWLAADGSRPAVDPNAPDALFTKSLLAALGQPGDKRNLAACLKDLQDHSQLRLNGFRSVGGVPAQLTLWEDEFGKQTIAPKPELVLQLGHADKVTGLVSTVDGGTTITASEDSTIRVWSGRERSLLRVLTGHSVGVTAMALSRDDQWLISGGGRGTVLVHDLKRDFASKEAPRPPHAIRVAQIVFFPDGIHFVSVDRSGHAFLWDPQETPLAPKPWPQGIACLEVACGGKLESRAKDTGVVVTRSLDGTVRIFDSTGVGGAILDVPEGKPTAMAVSPDGRALALGFQDGQVIVRILGKARAQATYHVATVPIQRLVFSSGGKLAVGYGTGARLLMVKLLRPGVVGDPHPEGFDLIDRSPQCLSFSPSGEYLAACTENIGALKNWRIDDDGPPRVVLDDPAAKAFLLSFSGNSRSLVVADFNGGVEARLVDPQGDERPWTFPAHRGKLQHLIASPNRRFLLAVDEGEQAQIWDLKERACRWLRGTWTSGAFLDDDRLVLSGVADATGGAPGEGQGLAEGQGRPGRLVLFDRNQRGSNLAFFARSSGKFTIDDRYAFTKLTLSADGTKLAASTDPRKVPLVCVWETKDGRLTHWIAHPRLRDGVEALSFSTEGRYLLTAGGSPVSQIWDLNAVKGEIKVPAAAFSDPATGKRNKVTCAVIRPRHSDQIVTGHVDGQVNVWTWANGQAKLSASRLVEEEFAGRVRTLCFTSDGQRLAAAGDGTTIWLGEMEPKPRAIRVLAGLRPHHFEQINALTTWPGQSILISGSDDTTIRFWDIAAGTLRGTFSSAVNPAVPEAAAIQELDWVLYTPDGHYDASTNGTKLVRFRVNDRGRPLDQFEKTLFTVQLSDQLLNRETPKVTQQPQDPPPISIVAPPPPDPAKPETKLTITLTSDELTDLRLYHNDVLIPCGLKEGVKPPSRELEVPVRLVPNRNRFYVMASQDGAFDSRSEEVEVNYVGPMEPGRLHVVALGVGDYQKRRLQYAQRDAERLSAVLQARGLDKTGQTGLRSLLPDAEVTRKNVEQAFDDIAEYVENRPQDTVVVFIAGHTGVFQGEKFCLLLASYPFPEDAPILVAARGAAPNQEEAKADPRFVLPYSVVALNLMRLKALNRLVIVDACQAEAIFDDPQVRSLQKWMEVPSRQVRTSYVMAARRGEESFEAEPLRHGILTYTLLRGLGAVAIANEPKVIADLGLPINADFNKDGILSTSELSAYAKQVLPQINDVFPKLMADARNALPRGKAPALPKRNVEQATRLQSSETSFPLVPLIVQPPRLPVAGP